MVCEGQSDGVLDSHHSLQLEYLKSVCYQNLVNNPTADCLCLIVDALLLPAQEPGYHCNILRPPSYPACDHVSTGEQNRWLVPRCRVSGQCCSLLTL